MRILTLNVNGIRSAARKGFFAWLDQQQADVVCLQEVRALESQILADALVPKGWHSFFAPAVKPGYSGVALLSREQPDDVQRGFGSAEFDPEGRYVEARFGTLSVVSVYMPSGSSSELRQQAKFRFMKEFTSHLDQVRGRGRNTILCGDWNIAHKAIDLKNWRSNQKNSGFLPEERAWLDQVFDDHGYVDAFRSINADPDQYTWWSNRGQAWAKNVGWRIDYHVMSPGLRGAARRAHIYKEQRFSDHAPLILDYEL